MLVGVATDVESWISKKNLKSIKKFEKRFITAQKIEKAKVNEDWFSNLKQVKMPSAGFDLMLGTYFERSDPSIGYLNYFLEDWKKIDFEDEENQAILTFANYHNYLTLKFSLHLRNQFSSSLQDINELNDFNGVFIIKNEFFIDSIRNNYSIDMGEISLGWAGELREFDFISMGQKLVQRLEMKILFIQVS